MISSPRCCLHDETVHTVITQIINHNKVCESVNSYLTYDECYDSLTEYTNFEQLISVKTNFETHFSKSQKYVVNARAPSTNS